MHLIYKATNNVNGKVYVGYTGTTLARRKCSHKSAALRGHSDTHFHRAIRKYGWEAFAWEVIYESEDMRECLEEREDHYIQELNAITHGYNMVKGGIAGSRMVGELNGMYGKSHSPEARALISAAQKGRNLGKSYEERYGERAAEIKMSRSETLKQVRRENPHTGRKNPHYDHTIYKFVREEESFVGTRSDFVSTYPYVKVPGLSALLNQRIPHYKGWTVLTTNIS